jgi:hypothetical protein
MYFAIQLTSFAVNIRIIRRKDAVIKQIIRRKDAVIKQIIRRKNAVISDCIRRKSAQGLGIYRYFVDLQLKNLETYKLRNLEILKLTSIPVFSAFLKHRVGCSLERVRVSRRWGLC